jgi:hypothetical protein
MHDRIIRLGTEPTLAEVDATIDDLLRDETVDPWFRSVLATLRGQDDETAWRSAHQLSQIAWLRHWAACLGRLVDNGGGTGA